MTIYSIDDAKHQLQQLIEEALQGKKIVIQSDDKQVVELVPRKISLTSRKAGSARGLIVMAEDFDAPLSDFDEYME